MKVFKFGGASVRHAPAIRQVGRIIKSFPMGKILVVVSAMGKTTNALERVVTAIETGKEVKPELDSIRAYHHKVAEELFPPGHSVFQKVKEVFEPLLQILPSAITKDQFYDQVVSTGEIRDDSLGALEGETI